jgi:membrane fusion protein, multidrug efflux system
MRHARREFLLFFRRKSGRTSRSTRLIRILLSAILGLVTLSLPACNEHDAHAEEPSQQTIVVTTPQMKDVVVTTQFVCQIHSKRHIKVRALQNGYLEEIKVKEGQMVEEGSVLFKIIPILYAAKRDAEFAEAQLATLELNYTKTLFDKSVVSKQEVLLYEAKLKRAQAKADLAQAEYSFTEVKAYFTGIIDRLFEQQGSLVKEGDVLTNLSDNSVMWVYFNVPEKYYIEYMKTSDKEKEEQRIDLQLANGTKFPQRGKIAAVEGKFNNQTGTIPFRADFPNPDRLLRHGMTGNVLLHKTLSKALVIPQRATFEILARRYVFVVDKDNVVHQREIKIHHEMNDAYVIESGLGVGDNFIYEGIRQVRDGDKIVYEYRAPEKILSDQKLYSE